MKLFTAPLLQQGEYLKLIETVNSFGKATTVGLSDPEKVFLSYCLSEHINRRIIYIAPNEVIAGKIYEDFLFYDNEAIMFPPKEAVLHNVVAYSREQIFKRTGSLSHILKNQYRITVTSPEALVFRLMTPEHFLKSCFSLNVGDEISIDNIVKRLSDCGYEREIQVSGQGQFAVRGGIADIYPVGKDTCYRVEFFGDTVDSIRVFDRFTQRSVENVATVEILPASESVICTENREKCVAAVESEYLKEKDDDLLLRQQIDADKEKILTQSWFPGIDRYSFLMPDMTSSFFDYITDDVLIIIDDKIRYDSRIKNMYLEHLETVRALNEKKIVLKNAISSIYDPIATERRISKHDILYHNAVTGNKETLNITIPAAPLQCYFGREDELKNDLIKWKKNKYSVVAVMSGKSKCERFCDTYFDDINGIIPYFTDNTKETVKPGNIAVIQGSLSKGFEFGGIGFVVLTDNDITGNEISQKKRIKHKDGKKITDFAQLAPGDYVVHQTHGIGVYVGISELEIGKIKKDYIKIKYSGTDCLYIPTTQMDLIQKYIGSENTKPKINKLGGGEWEKTKSRVKASLRDLASELIKLYAKRRESKGFMYSKDSAWQKQFEDKFEYEETDDQLKCIAEIKEDMESPRIMDRLLCGDVGYGKTEVAVRAMFKAVMDGRQVAYLVPTTVLAQQQEENVRRRVKDFAVSVASLSRFKTQSEQARIIEDTRKGNIDILIGTHRILQKDVRFKNLGLLVIDEEQRFGVSHKEKIKELKPDVDTLVMSATPIPRTLHMSMTGIRDISIIDEPPDERYPVQTFVMEYDADVVSNVIYRELAREGQVFYLYNSVRGIEIKAEQIRKLVPEAKVAIAHGQMPEGKLEDIMRDFCAGEYNVLICTTIIESGLDIPNANTIIVENADMLGLSQLYQIRGRVGRSSRLAYAYIMYRPDKVLNENAEKRIRAIKEFTEFGAGYKIALRDLEIRGAGNLLGAEQHGHMESVGYDMYTRLLDEAVCELSGKTIKKENVEFTIEVPFSAYIPPEYIKMDTLKIDAYKRIAEIQSEEECLDVRDELIDRFGNIPKETDLLIDIADMKQNGIKAGFIGVTVSDGRATLLFNGRNEKFSGEAGIRLIAELTRLYGRKYIYNASVNPFMQLVLSEKNDKAIINEIKLFFCKIIYLQNANK